MQSAFEPQETWISEFRQKRRGVFIVVMAVSMAACLAFVAFSVDTGMVILNQTRMQNSVDAAALAAANEISHAVETATSNVGDITTYALAQSRLKAQSVAALNGVYIDPNTDVQFGRWQLNQATQTSSITWGATPSNAVKVTARRTNADTTQPDGQVKTLFAGVFGKKAVSITTTGTAYIESRDIGMVLDYSASMNDDSCYDALSTRNRAALDTNMEQIYNQLDAVRDFGSMTFTPRWFQWTTNATSPDNRYATVVFKNSSVDVTTNSTMTGVTLYSGSNSTSPTASGTSGTYTYSSKSIDKVAVTMKGNLAPTTGAATYNTWTANVTFNNSTSNVVSVTANKSMLAIRLTYADNTTQNFTVASLASTSVTGNGKYVKSARVTFASSGSPTATANNPAGTTQPSNFSSTTLTVQMTDANIQSWLALPTYPWGSTGSWSEFFTHCKTDSTINSAGHRYKFGGACLVNYLLRNEYQYNQCNDLWRTSHYPFHSCKQGALLFCDFLEDLGFGDEVGAVSFDVNSRREEILDYDGYSINISANPVCNDFESIRQIVRHRQAAHYSGNTNIGAGIYQGRMMLDASKRPGTRPTLLILTDGAPTAQDSGWTFPSDWNWNALFDYDGDGTANYTSTDSNAKYGLMRAKEAVDAGYTIHTMTVGLGGDPAYMEAIAHLGGGITITVPGDQTVEQMEADILVAFNKIAAFVPPARLVKPQ
jgi:Flp pilus assembly protein TadG